MKQREHYDLMIRATTVAIVVVMVTVVVFYAKHVVVNQTRRVHMRL